MPIYDYACKKCGNRFEKIQKFSDPEVKRCPKCGGKVEKLLSPPAVQFKGSGWYATDYSKKATAKPSSETAATSPGDSTGSATSKESVASSESKTSSQSKSSTARKNPET